MPSINLLPEDFTIDSYKKKEKIAVLALAVFFLIISGFVYAASEYEKRASQKNLDTVNEQIVEVDKQIEEEISSNEIFSSEFNKGDIEGLLDSHLYFSKILTFLQSYTVKNVALTEVAFKYDEDDGYIAEITASVDSYDTAIDQIAIFKNSFWTKDVVFSEVSVDDDAYISMSGVLYFREEILHYHEQYWYTGINVLEEELNRYIDINSFSASIKTERNEDGDKEEVIAIKFGGTCYDELELTRMEKGLSSNGIVKSVEIIKEDTSTPGVKDFVGNMKLEY